MRIMWFADCFVGTMPCREFQHTSRYSITPLLVQSEQLKQLKEEIRGAKDVQEKLQKKLDILAGMQVRHTNDFTEIFLAPRGVH